VSLIAATRACVLGRSATRALISMLDGICSPFSIAPSGNLTLNVDLVGGLEDLCLALDLELRYRPGILALK
jgi:hypothetical protein